MKTTTYPSSGFDRLITILGTISVAVLFCSCSGNSTDVVQQAFELRLQGQADSSRVLLEEAIAADSSNAAAWFELARTKHHIGLGNPRILFSTMGELHEAATRAVTNDPANLTYAFYLGYVSYLNAYISFMGDQTTAQERVSTTVAAFEQVLKLQPDYLEPRLFLVELLSVPAGMGGDSLRAEQYAAELEAMDAIMGAKARELLLPEEGDRVDYWEQILKKYPEDAAVIEQLGKAYLYQEKVAEGMQQLELAYKTAPDRQMLLLDMARFYLMTSRQDETQSTTVLPRAASAINRYLETMPLPPLRAFALSMLAWTQDGLGALEEATQLRVEAQELDPNVSKTFGIPPALLFSGLDEVSHYHSFFFRPF
ncbi:hypothetical protein H8D51_02025 [bacterium]|nr:hypothetical protein [bacterium]